MTGRIITEDPQLRIVNTVIRAPRAASTSLNAIAAFSPRRHVNAPCAPPTLVTRCDVALVIRCGVALACESGEYLGVEVTDEVGTTASGTAGVVLEHPAMAATAATTATTRLIFIAAP
jgi:hypothetical protein